jgi:hypothetical protein
MRTAAVRQKMDNDSRVVEYGEVKFKKGIMKQIHSDRTIAIWIVSAVAIGFGLATIKSGGEVLFGGNIYQNAAGNYVSFVVWFNFLAGFIYLVAGVGIWMRRNWAVWLSLSIAIATVIVFSILGMHILNGGRYETRTVAAMSLRSMVWICIFIFAYRKILRQSNGA